MHDERLATAIEAVSQFLVADAPLGETLHRIAVAAEGAIGPAAAVGVTLLDGRRQPSTAVYTDELSPAVDRGQYEDGAGPCLDAYRQSRTIRVDEITAEAERWPRFCRDAAAQAIRSTLSLPLRAGSEALGVMNLYARSSGAFSTADEAGAELFAAQAAVVLANARAYWEAFDLAAGLRQAQQGRVVIEHAKARIMATHGCNADEAFRILLRRSQRADVPLRDLARGIVEGRAADLSG